MIIKNNSKHEWLNYNCGGDFFIDITAGCVFDVPESVGALLLKNLGHEKWLVKVDVLSAEDKKELKTYAEHKQDKFEKEHPEEVKRQKEDKKEDKVEKKEKKVEKIKK